MATTLDILVIPTYNTLTLGVADASVYDSTPSAPTMTITVPGFGDVSIPFNINDFNVYNSAILGITQFGEPLLPLPDGVYTLKYTITPENEFFVVKNIMRIDQLQEKFDSAFMKLDMMQCDLAIKTQQKVDLTSINFFIQGSIAAANNCAVDTSNKLYNQASKMLNNFMKNGCQCSGTNYLTNFY